MKNPINRRKIIIVFLIMVSTASFYFAYKKTRINRPIAAKLVYSNIKAPCSMLQEVMM